MCKICCSLFHLDSRKSCYILCLWCVCVLWRSIIGRHFTSKPRSFHRRTYETCVVGPFHRMFFYQKNATIYGKIAVHTSCWMCWIRFYIPWPITITLFLQTIILCFDCMKDVSNLQRTYKDTIFRSKYNSLAQVGIGTSLSSIWWWQ